MNEMMWVQLGFFAVVGVGIVVMYLRQAALVRGLERDREVAQRDKDASRRALDVMVAAADSGAADAAAVGRRLQVLDEGPMCDNCAHFDLEEGQAQMQQHRAFAQVSQLVSPAMMSQEAKVDNFGNLLVDGDGVLEKTEPSVPHKTKWSDFGACMKHNEARWKGDKCGEYASAAPSDDAPVGA